MDPKCIIPSNEQERLTALQNYHILDTKVEEQFDRITELASIICETPISLISLIDANRQWFKSSVGLTVSETPREISFCQHAILNDSFFQINDATSDDRFNNNPLVTGDPNIRFYAAYPLIDTNGFALGTLCVIDKKPKLLTESQKNALHLLSQEVIYQIILRKSLIEKNYYDHFFESSPDLFCIAGTDGYFKKVNPTFNSLLGWKYEELVGKPFLDFFHPDDVLPTMTEMEKLKGGKTTIGFINRFKTKDGFYKSIEWDANSDPASGVIFANGRDITEKILTNEKLEKSLKRNHELEFALDEAAIVAITDAKGKITYANSKFCEISGFSEAELIGKDHRIVNSGYHSKEFMKDLWRTIASGKVFKAELRNKKKTGEFYWVDTTIVPFLNDQGKPNQYIVIRHDVTKRKNFEVQIQDLLSFQSTILNSTDYSIIVNDVNGKIILFNKGSEQMLGYAAEELLGKDSVSIIHDRFEIEQRAVEFSRELGINVDPGFQTITAKSRQGKPDVNEWTYIKKDGTRIYVLLSITALRDKNQEIIGYLKAARDITDRKQMEDELRIAKKIAERNLIEKDNFLANMSHEIRTPMNAIIGFSDVLKKTKLNSEQYEFLEAISIASENLLTLINDILDFSKIESGNLKIEKKPVNIKKIINDIKKIFSVKASEKQIGLGFYLDSDIPEWINSDPTRINQILINLIGNAIKFTSAGKVSVFTSIVSKTGSNCIFEFLIKDTGIGIHEDKLNLIFERFQQAEEYTTRKYGGTGLGLSITKKLVEMFGGTIHVTSKPGAGSEFAVRIPFELAAVNQSPIPEAEPEHKLNLQPLKILLVEDNRLNQKLAIKILEKSGTISTAENGIEAIEYLKKNSYDIILMDLQMPVLDGYKATTIIRTELKIDTPIIAMTAHSLVGEKEKCLEYGMNEYISKPYKPSELIEKIQSICFNKESNITEEITPETVNSSSKRSYDIKDLVQLSDNDTKFIRESVEIFLADIPNEINHLKEHLEQNNFEALRKTAHKMRSSFQLFLVSSATELSREIEFCQDNTRFNILVPELLTAAYKVVDELKQDFSEK